MVSRKGRLEIKDLPGREEQEPLSGETLEQKGVEKSYLKIAQWGVSKRRIAHTSSRRM